MFTTILVLEPSLYQQYNLDCFAIFSTPILRDEHSLVNQKVKNRVAIHEFLDHLLVKICVDTLSHFF